MVVNYPGGYNINLYGTTILIMAATYDKQNAELKINDMWIPNGIIIPQKL